MTNTTHATKKYNPPLRLLAQLAVLMACLWGLALSTAAYDGSWGDQVEYAEAMAKYYSGQSSATLVPYQYCDTGDSSKYYDSDDPTECWTMCESYATYGRSLYVVEIYPDDDCNDVSNISFSMSYSVTANGVTSVYYLQPFDIISATAYAYSQTPAKSFNSDALTQDNKLITFTLSLPHCDEGTVKILSISTMRFNGTKNCLFFSSDGSMDNHTGAGTKYLYNLYTAATYVIPVQGNQVYGYSSYVSGSMSGTSYSGYRYVYEDSSEQSAYYAEYSLSAINGGPTSGSVWNTPMKSMSYSSGYKYDPYVIEYTTGSNGYDGDGYFAVNYTAGSTTGTMTAYIQRDYDLLHTTESLAESKHSGSYDTIVTPSFGKDWLSLTTIETFAITRYSTDSWYYEAQCDTNMLPYTSSTLIVYLPTSTSLTINYVELYLSPNSSDTGDTSVSLQNFRITKLDESYGYTEYWNGGLGLERSLAYKGTVVFESDWDGETAFSQDTYYTLCPSSNSRYVSPDYAASPKSYSITDTGEGVAVTIKLADVIGAGFEGLLSDDVNNLTYWWANGNGDSRDNITSNYRFREALQLGITYVDTSGSTRKVEIPFLTLYMAYLYHESSGITAMTLVQASAASTNNNYVLAGVFQQNEEVGLPFRLDDYDYLVSLTLTLEDKETIFPELRDYQNYREQVVLSTAISSLSLSDLESAMITSLLANASLTDEQNSYFTEKLGTLSSSNSSAITSALQTEASYYVEHDLFSYPMGWPAPVASNYPTTEEYYNALAGYNANQQLSNLTSLYSYVVDPNVDTISIEYICFYEGVTTSNFNGYGYSKINNYSPRCPLVETSLTPAFHYASTMTDGTVLTKSYTLTINTANLNVGAPSEKSYDETFLLELTIAQNSVAATNSDIYFYVNYTDLTGVSRDSQIFSLRELVTEYYGPTDRITPYYDQYEKRMSSTGDVARCLVDLPGLSSVNYIRFELQADPYDKTIADSDSTSDGDDVQFSSATLYSVSDVGQRYMWTGGQIRGNTGPYYGRAVSATTVSVCSEGIYLYATGSDNARFMYFDNYVDGVLVENDMEEVSTTSYDTLPTSLSYTEACTNLYLTTIRHTYQVEVTVGSEDEAGSGNYFYFQLVFEDGTSAVVLANQQLSSDTFRVGKTETFYINTTQYYGDVTSVRVICDNTASTSSVFDKLQVDTIRVYKETSSGTKTAFVTDTVGWIDITYQDEGASSTSSELSAFTTASDVELTNGEIIKDYPIIATQATVTMLFAITTLGDSGLTDDPGTISCTLSYYDSNLSLCTKTFDLISAIKDFNDNQRTDWMFRANHTDRFTIDLTDVYELVSLSFQRSGSSDYAWQFDPVSVYLVPELGDVYLSADDEYRRDLGSDDVSVLTTSNNGCNIAAKNQATVIFPDNTISFEGETTYSSWLTSLSRIPTASRETVNTVLFSTEGKYTFKSDDGDKITANIIYTTASNGGALSSYSPASFNVTSLGGVTVLSNYGDSIEAALTFSTLQSSLVSVSNSVNAYMDFAIFQRIRDNVIVDTHTVPLGDTLISVMSTAKNGENYFLTELDSLTFTKTEVVSGKSTTVEVEGGWYTNQQVEIYLAANQSASLVAETSDIAVALRYTSLLDSTDTVYRSPYYYVTDSGVTSISSSDTITVDMDVHGIREIVGITVASNCDTALTLDGITVNQYDGPLYTTSAKLATYERTSSNYLGSYSLDYTFIPSSIAQEYDFTSESLTPVTLEFTTPTESEMSGATSTGSFGMTIGYVDNTGLGRILSYDDITSFYYTTDSGTTAMKVYLPGLQYVTSVTLTTSSQDSWFIDRLAVSTSSPSQTNYSCDTSVNNWVVRYSDLTIDVTPSEFRETGSVVGNDISSLNLTATSSATDALSVTTNYPSSISTLTVPAYTGTSVTLTPSLTVTGSPDSSFYWSGSTTTLLSGSSYSSLNALSGASTGGAATFTVPYNAQVGDVFYLTLSTTVDSYSISIIIQVVEKPVTTTTTTDSSSGDTADGTTEDAAEDAAEDGTEDSSEPTTETASEE